MLNLVATVGAVLILTQGISLPLPAESPEPWLAMFACLLLPLGSFTLGQFHQQQANRALATGSRPDAIRHLEKGRRRTTMASLFLFATAVFIGDWVVFVKTSVAPKIPLATHLIALAPFLAACIAGWLPIYRCEAKLFPTREGVAERLRADLRPMLLPLAPFLLFMAVLDLGWYLPVTQELLATNALAATGGLLMLLFGILTFAPLVVRYLWPSTPLPAGPLRDRLESLAQRAGIGYRDIRIWHTGSRGIMNACISGLVARFRYIFITDALLESLDEEELEGVFAHELGHARHGHFMIYFAVVVAFFLAYMASVPYLPANPFSELAILGVAAYLYFWGFFGMLSRQLEHQADHYGAELVGSPTGLAQALQKIAYATRSLHRKGSWRHPSIPSRVESLWNLAHNQSARRSFQRKTRQLLGLVAIACLCSLAAYSLDMLRISRRPEFERNWEVAHYLLREYRERTLRPGRDLTRETELLERSRVLLAQAEKSIAPETQLSGDRREMLLQLAQVYELLGRDNDAQEARETADSLDS